jgi:hypothetical protein
VLVLASLNVKVIKGECEMDDLRRHPAAIAFLGNLGSSEI